MTDVDSLFVTGLKWDQDHLWIAASQQRLIARHDPRTGETEEKLRYPHETWDICPSEEGLWIMTGGGRLGRQLVLWSFSQGTEQRVFNCPDGAGAGIALYDGRLWVLHRHNRKLFCLDPKDGKVIWVTRTEHESFSPAVYGSEFWLIESDPGPLGHWSPSGQTKFFISRFDPARETVVERLPAPFVPSCLAVNKEEFWYGTEDRAGLSSTKKNFGQLRAIPFG
jgi:outer membrane protein assembly factor BamB